MKKLRILIAIFLLGGALTTVSAQNKCGLSIHLGGIWEAFCQWGNSPNVRHTFLLVTQTINSLLTEPHFSEHPWDFVTIINLSAPTLKTAGSEFSFLLT